MERKCNVQGLHRSVTPISFCNVFEHFYNFYGHFINVLIHFEMFGTLQKHFYNVCKHFYNVSAMFFFCVDGKINCSHNRKGNTLKATNLVNHIIEHVVA